MTQLSIQPRVCGDYLFGHSISGRILDTTPRVRGLLGQTSAIGLQGRYNPACAGTTFGGPLFVISSTIQPRVCGDYTAIWTTGRMR